METTQQCIFYVDDDQDDQQLFKEVVTTLDRKAEVHVHNDGQELMDQLQSPPPRPTVIFLDLNMPRKNGLQVLKELQQKEELKNVPVVIFTTSNDEISIDKTLDLGAKAFVTKPSYFQNFRKIVAQCLAIDWNKINPTRDKFVVNLG